MSLNWREIDALLDELDLPGYFIQDVYQPDFRNLHVELFRPAGARFLRICLETGRTRFHTVPRRPPKPKVRQRFAQMLHSRIRGAHIIAARQVNADRIVRLDVKRAEESSTIWLRLWGGASNCILTDRDGTIIDAFFRRPSRGEVSGGRFVVEEHEVDAAADGKLARFQPRWTSHVDEAVREHYAALEQAEAHEHALSRARNLLESAAASVRRRLDELTRRASDVADPDRFQTIGDLIVSNIYRIHAGASWLDAADYTTGNETVRIELDPSRSAQANAQGYYERAQRARRQSQAIVEERSTLELRLLRLDEALDSLEKLAAGELRAIVDELTPAAPGASRTEVTPGLRFVSNGFTILVGRNSRENDALLRRYVRGNDLWLHTRDYPGGYVFIKSERGKSVPLDVLLDAGNLAIHYSKAKPNGNADLYYTSVKYLRRSKDGPVGLVLPTNEKNLHVTTEQARLSRLLGTRGS